MIGCGRQAETQVARPCGSALPEISSTVVFCREREAARGAFAHRIGAEPAESRRKRLHRTWSSRSRRRRTPCCAASGSAPARSCARPARMCPPTASWTTRCSSGPRFVCCDALGEDAKLESGDRSSRSLREYSTGWKSTSWPRSSSARLSGRQSDDDIVVFKSNGIAAWDVAAGAAAVTLAREPADRPRALGHSLPGAGGQAERSRPEPYATRGGGAALEREVAAKAVIALQLEMSISSSATLTSDSASASSSARVPSWLAGRRGFSPPPASRAGSPRP